MTEERISYFTFSDAIAVLNKRKRLILSLFLVTVLAVTIVVYLIPPTFQADAKVLVKRLESGEKLFSIKGDKLVPDVAKLMAQREELNTEMEIIRSSPIIEEMITNLQLTEEKMDEILDFRKYVRATYKRVRTTLIAGYESVKYFLGLGQRPSLDQVAAFKHLSLVEAIKDKLTIEMVGDSDVLTLGFKVNNPYLAVKMANSLSESYLLYHQRIFRNPTTLDFFQKTTGGIEQSLKQAEVDLDNLKNKWNLYAPEEQRKMMVEAYVRTNIDLKTLQGQIEQAKAKIQELKRQIALQPQTIPQNTVENRNPLIQEYNRRLLDLESRRTSLLQKYKEDSSFVTGVDAEIQSVKKRLAEQAEMVSDSQTYTVNPIYQSLTQQFIDAQIQLASLTAQENATVNNLSFYTGRLDTLTKKSLEIEQISRFIKSREEVFNLSLRNKNQLQLARDLVQSRITDVQIIDPASIPLAPIAPNKWAYIGIAAVVSLLVGITLAFTLEGLNKSDFKTRLASSL